MFGNCVQKICSKFAGDHPHLLSWICNMNSKTCKKISCYMCDPVCKWRFLQNAKICCSYVKYF